MALRHPGPSTSRRRFLGGAMSVGAALALPVTLAEHAAAATDAAFTPATLPDTRWHLTARPWRPTYRDATGFLDVGESIARVHASRQDGTGAVIDAYSGREQQYSTPYFAVSVALLLSHGRATDLLAGGVAAMDRATAQVARGRSAIPENHGEFFVAALATALPLYRPFVSAGQYDTWRTRLGTPIGTIIQGLTHNWRSYAMKGEWLRARNGFVDRATAVRWIESSWRGTQRDRLTGNRWNQYTDRSGTPDTHIYDAAARSNLFALVQAGYDGASSGEMSTLLQRGAKTSLLMQEPSGQNPAGGRSGDHVWNDVYSGNVFAQLAEFHRTRDPLLAGQFRHAALMNLGSIDRWRRDDGSYSVTKNHFDPAARVGYADYSWFQNYNGNVMFHTLESYELATSAIAEQPVPSEIGGYGFATDPVAFGSAFANAGGMQMQASMVGSTSLSYGQYWAFLGVSRFGRVGWDSRLGPANGVRNPTSGRAVTFAPTFPENGSWLRLAELPGRYEGTPTFTFVHPLLVRWSIDYRPRDGSSGPTFRNDFVVTPDGVLSTVTSSAATFGVTIPMVENDGRALDTGYGDGVARMAYPWQSDEQNFIALQGAAVFDATAPLIRGAVGDVRPTRMTVPGASSNQVFVYPRSAGDPTAAEVRTSFTRTGNDFTSVLGRVKGTLYVGRTSAGGYGDAIDLDGGGGPDVTFSTACYFVLQLYRGQVVAVEADRAVTATVQGRSLTLAAYTPVAFDVTLPVTATASAAQDGSPASNVTDASATSRWSATGLGATLRLDVGSVRGISGVRIAWHQGDSRVARFDVQTSSNGTSWTTVVAGARSSGTTAGPESYPLGALTARYLRIVNRGNSVNDWIAITGATVTGW